MSESQLSKKIKKQKQFKKYFAKQNSIHRSSGFDDNEIGASIVGLRGNSMSDVPSMIASFYLAREQKAAKKAAEKQAILSNYANAFTGFIDKSKELDRLYEKTEEKHRLERKAVDRLYNDFKSVTPMQLKALESLYADDDEAKLKIQEFKSNILAGPGQYSLNLNDLAMMETNFGMKHLGRWNRYDGSNASWSGSSNNNNYSAYTGLSIV
jgi:hypothetical protein